MSVQSPTIGSGLEYYEKLWPNEFSEDRNPEEDSPLVEYRLADMLSVIDLSRDEATQPPDSIDQNPVEMEPFEERGEPNRLELFLRAYDNDVPTIEDDEITGFCRGVHPSVLRQREKNQRSTAWLDDRLYLFYGTPESPQTHARHESATIPAVPNASAPKRKENTTTANEEASHSSAQGPNTGLPYRKYNSPLSASLLYEHLKEQVRRFIN